MSSEDILFASGEVGMHLTGQERILGDVGVPGVVVQGEEQEPDNADDDTEERQNIRETNEKHIGFIPQVADRGCISLLSVLP